ncbi:MAG: hypothetical protein PHW04_18485, partial [Candidatus Wallbacteria bacterium]|nr:hypothetical protein [Candidatus Wallbacteria bacterium]
MNYLNHVVLMLAVLTACCVQADVSAAGQNAADIRWKFPDLTEQKDLMEERRFDLLDQGRTEEARILLDNYYSLSAQAYLSSWPVLQETCRISNQKGEPQAVSFLEKKPVSEVTREIEDLKLASDWLSKRKSPVTLKSEVTLFSFLMLLHDNPALLTFYDCVLKDDLAAASDKARKLGSVEIDAAVLARMCKSAVKKDNPDMLGLIRSVVPLKAFAEAAQKLVSLAAYDNKTGTVKYLLKLPEFPSTIFSLSRDRDLYI